MGDRGTWWFTQKTTEILSLPSITFPTSLILHFSQLYHCRSSTSQSFLSAVLTTTVLAHNHRHISDKQHQHLQHWELLRSSSSFAVIIICPSDSSWQQKKADKVPLTILFPLVGQEKNSHSCCSRSVTYEKVKSFSPPPPLKAPLFHHLALLGEKRWKFDNNIIWLGEKKVHIPSLLLAYVTN